MSSRAMAERKAAGPATRGSTQPPASAIRRGLDSPARTLDASTRQFFEPRLGHDFSRVRVHTNAEAAASASSVQAHAYTFGNDVVFGEGRYDPGTRSGQRLLGHELTHVAQQAGALEDGGEGSLRPSDAMQENEAQRMSSDVMAGRRVQAAERRSGPVLARFSDTNHHALEEAALATSGLTGEQVEGLERGNVKRDYSQLPAAANALFLGHAQTFGGYSPDEHIDNFIFDVEHDRWRSRGVGPQKYRYIDPDHADFGPIDHIAAQLRDLAEGGMGKDSMEHLGSAFHTVEDFFAHSNFIELTHQDYRFGKDLLTASVTTQAGNETAALAQVMGSVAPANMQEHYAAASKEAAAGTETTSHANMNKDTSQSRGFAKARRLAALVVQELAADVIRVMAEPDTKKRAQRMQDVVVSKIRHYLRPPDPNDRWWEGLASHGAGASMDARLAEADRRTPVTVNHKPWSPLRNMEASKDAPMALPLGLAANMGRYGFLQAGVGVTRPDMFDSRFLPPAAPGDQQSSPVAGIQWTGHFP